MIKRLLTVLATLLLTSYAAFAAEDGLVVFLRHLDQPWALFFVIGATISSIPLVILIFMMVRGLFNQNRFYPQRRSE